MSIRKKYAAIAVVSILIGTLSVMLMGQVHLHGYALLPFVVVAGASFFVAWVALFNVLFPQKNPVEESIDSITYLILNILFGVFRH